MQWSDINWERTEYSSQAAYGQSKLANILFTRELATRLKEGENILQMIRRKKKCFELTIAKKRRLNRRQEIGRWNFNSMFHYHRMIDS